MTLAHVMFILSATLLSCVVTYAWWTVIRIVELREDLFIIRNGLFDVASSCDAFDDPAYLSARAQLDGLIRLADFLSLPILFYLVAFVDHKQPQSPPFSKNAQLQAAIENARSAAAARMARFAIRHTLLGQGVAMIFSIVPEAAFRNAVARRLDDMSDEGNRVNLAT